VPVWARGAALMDAVRRQQSRDPDRIFRGKECTCTLDEVFDWQAGLQMLPPAKAAAKRDCRRRGSSGNWIEDRVTWQEEMAYKKAMGFL
jgi:hypothetical protein